MTLTGTTIPGQNGPGCNGYEGVLYFSQTLLEDGGLALLQRIHRQDELSNEDQTRYTRKLFLRDKPVNLHVAKSQSTYNYNKQNKIETDERRSNDKQKTREKKKAGKIVGSEGETENSNKKHRK